jgi:16S rRNA (cytosine967-C5)-methyltransferase
MKRSSLFGHVIELHDVVRNSRQPADTIVREFVRSRHYLGSKDRRFITEMVFGLLRHFRLVQVCTEEALRRLGRDSFSKQTPSILLAGAYCIRLLNEDPEALVSDLSGLMRVSAPDVPCEEFLRSVSLPQEIEQNAAVRLATLFSFPDSIVSEWTECYGTAESEQLCASLNQPAPVTIRVNTLLTTVDQCRAQLREEGLETTRTALSPVGLILPKRINAQTLNSFKGGSFEMQDEGSQLLSMLVQASPGTTVVDACAGGGGKTLHLAALMSNQGTLIAIDADRQRLLRMEERLRRSGASMVRCFQAGKDRNEIEKLHETADSVLIDAPCTGVGTVRRNPGVKARFTSTLLESMVKRQQQVLDEYSALVRPGGRLVYATCSLLRRENEEQVSGFLQRHPDFTLGSASWILRQQGVPLDSNEQMLTLLPHKTGTDGFFAAVMIRRGRVDS